MLSKPSLDKESRLEVIYRVLKDQLKRARSDLVELKKAKDREKQQGLQIKKSMSQQTSKVKIVQKKDDKMEVAGGVIADAGFQKVANHLLQSDVRRHSRYCPCCREYDTGNEPTPYQMGEFIEYIKQLHYKLGGTRPKTVKRNSLPEDSVDDLTDLDEPGILTSSLGQFSYEEQVRLKRYVNEMRKV